MAWARICNHFDRQFIDNDNLAEFEAVTLAAVDVDVDTVIYYTRFYLLHLLT